MLDKAVSAVKADQAKAIDIFNKGEGGFKDLDLFPFCFNLSDGMVVATQTQPHGTDIRTLKDKSGKDFGPKLFEKSKVGTVGEVADMFPRPGTDQTPVQKVSFVTAVAGHGCAVGYDK